MMAMDFRALFAAERAAQHAAHSAASAAAASPPAAAPAPPPPPLLPVAPGLSYCNAFLNPAEAAALTMAIDAIPTSQWAPLTKRRLLNLGGVPHPSGSWAEPLPSSLCALVRPRLAALGVSFDQILLNEYLSGAGIGGHKDGPCFAPRAAIVSLGGDALLHFSKAGPEGPPCASVLVRANSLVVFEGEAYTGLFHYIEDTAVEEVPATCVNAGAARAEAGARVRRPQRRLSLTLRSLARVERTFGEFEAVPPDVEEERRRRTQWWLQSISEK